MKSLFVGLLVSLLSVPSALAASNSDNWSVRCNTDSVTGMRTCFAGTFGRSMNHHGKPYGSRDTPFKVMFFDDSGPHMSVGYHTYPGRGWLVRVDDHKPLSGDGDSAAIVDQMLTGRVVRARYHSWPEGAHDMHVDLAGFPQAWARLNALKSKR